MSEDHDLDQVFEEARASADWLDAKFEPSPEFLDAAVRSTLQRVDAPAPPTTTPPPRPPMSVAPWVAGIGAAVVVVLALVLGPSAGSTPSVAAEPAAAAPASPIPVDPISSPSASPKVDPSPVGLSAAAVIQPVEPEAIPAASTKSMPSAADLFRTANQYRSDDRFDLARTTYRELLTRHPRSRESQMARISLGRLELEHFERPEAALVLFDAYLAKSGAQTLAGEALVGRARALDALGDDAGEASAWRRLLEEHPDTPHADRARLRLDQLGG